MDGINEIEEINEWVFVCLPHETDEERREFMESPTGISIMKHFTAGHDTPLTAGQLIVLAFIHCDFHHLLPEHVKEWVFLYHSKTVLLLKEKLAVMYWDEITGKKGDSVTEWCLSFITKRVV